MWTIDYVRAQNILMEWAPKVLVAIVILVVTHFLAKALQWALARGIDRIPGIRQHNSGAAPKETAGYHLGQLGYWVVLLIGVIGALTTLGLSSVVAPLNNLLLEITAYIPNLLGAAIIFFVGLIVATLARRIVETALAAARVDAWLEKAQLSRLTGASGLAKTLGTLAFVLVVIPVSIAALQQLGLSAISDPAVVVLSTVLDALPRVLAAAIVLAIAFLIGRWVASLLEQILPSLGFDRSLQALDVGVKSDMHAPPASAEESVPSTAPGRVTPSIIVARLALVAIMLFSAVEAARLLAFSAVAVMLAEILELAGSVLFGGVIITAGVLIAHLLTRLIDRSTDSTNGFASTIVRWATIALATAMGLRFMGIADEIVVLAFGLILGSASVAAALAFGIGGREAAGRLLDRWTRLPRQSSGEPSVARPRSPRAAPPAK